MDKSGEGRTSLVTLGTIARMAGNIAAGLCTNSYYYGRDGKSLKKLIAVDAIEIARLIIEHLEQEPPQK